MWPQYFRKYHNILLLHVPCSSGIFSCMPVSMGGYNLDCSHETLLVWFTAVFLVDFFLQALKMCPGKQCNLKQLKQTNSSHMTRMSQHSHMTNVS